MKKLFKKHLKLLITLLILILIILTYVFNWGNIKTKTVNKISSLTIPFSLVVNPKNVDKGITPRSIKLNDKDFEGDKTQAINLVNTINGNYKTTKDFNFLTEKQDKSLTEKIKKQSHQYIHDVTLLNFGKDRKGKYLTVSLNQYNDTDKIISYRYRLYHKKNEIFSVKYLKSTSNTYPPRFIIPDVKVGETGINNSKNFMQRLKTAIINSNLSMNNASEPGSFNQIAINLGLDPDKSNKGLYNLAKNSNSRVTNYGIVGYEISDVPRYSRVYIKQLSKDNHFYYTLTYNRNSNKFIRFQSGIISTNNNK